MNDALKEALSDEIDFVRNWLAYPDYEPAKFETLAEAREQIDNMKLTDDLPDGLWDPEITLLVWNYCVEHCA